MSSSFSFAVVHSVMSNPATPWIAACQASLSFTVSWSLLKLMSIGLVMPSNHLVLCCPLLLPSILPTHLISLSSGPISFYRWVLVRLKTMLLLPLLLCQNPLKMEFLIIHLKPVFTKLSPYW